MRALSLKLLRDLRRLWAQSLAIALVLGCGIMVMSFSYGTQASLEAARNTYYERHRFADVFSSLTRAPKAVLEALAALPGVQQVEGRVVFTALLVVPGLDAPATGRLLSLPSTGEPRLNVPLVRSGRLPSPLSSHEVALSEPFAQANALRPGDRFSAVLNGRQRTLTVTGTVLSPEYIYTIGAGALMPDDRHFGLLWMRENALAAAQGLDGAFNDLALSLAPNAVRPAILAAVDRILAPYGGSGAYDRSRQASNVFIEGEMKQLRALGQIQSPIFFLVAAFLVHMVLGRLVSLDRPQLGLLKAEGYGTATLATHYLKMTFGIAVLGIILGGLGGWWLGREMTALYTEFFRFPFLIYRPGLSPLLVASALALATVIFGALRAVFATVALPPAVAMAPPKPPAFHHSGVDRLALRLRLRQGTLIMLRSVLRWPGRALVTVLGVMGSVTVLVLAFFSFDAVDLVSTELFETSNRQDATLALARPLPEAAVRDALALPGVGRAEGHYALPVRLRHGLRSRLVSLQAYDEEHQLTQLLSAGGTPATVPGLALPEGLAKHLNIQVGEVLTLELLAPPREHWRLPVAAVLRQSLGQDAYLPASTLFSKLRQAPQVTQIHVAFDSAALPSLEAAVRDTPLITGFTRWATVRAQFLATVSENLVVMSMIFATLGALITIGVIYNAARIQLAERSHELASLRVLGFRRSEVAQLLLSEQALLTLLAIPPGWALGYGATHLLAQGFSTDVVSIPIVVTARTYALAALLVLAAAAGTLLVMKRHIDRLDMLTALKQKG